MKYIKCYENKINEELLELKTLKNMFTKKIGTHVDRIWIHIKILNEATKEIPDCFIENEMIATSHVNVKLMKTISDTFKLNLYDAFVNSIEFDKIKPVCEFLETLGLEVNTYKQNENSTEILITGKLSEVDIRHKLH